MCTATRTLSLAVVVVLLDFSSSAPVSKNSGNSTTEVESTLERFLDVYYDRYVERRVGNGIESPKTEDKSEAKSEGDIYETMQGDQPAVDGNQGLVGQYGTNISGFQGLSGYRVNVSDQYMEAVRNRSKENFIKFLKNNILEHIGRGNFSTQKINDARISALNISEIMPTFLNSTNLLSDDQITEKIRSFYPSCEVPLNTDQDAWKDDDIMNLFFNFDYISNDKNTNIATATLRLYRLPDNSTQANTRSEDCDDMNSTEEEKLLRVSIYWYTKSLKKRRGSECLGVNRTFLSSPIGEELKGTGQEQTATIETKRIKIKRRLADSKVIPDNSRWVELSVKPAAKAWTRGRNLGLGILVEDQDGNMLRADKYFKGASCTVGTSTPKPIPTIIIDAARKSNELHRIDSLLRGNSTSAVYSDVHLLPTIDLCTLDFPENYTQPAHVMSLRINACNLRDIHEQNIKLAEKERMERIATLPDLLATAPRHIRHQRQYLANKMAAAQAETSQARFNFTTINR